MDHYPEYIFTAAFSRRERTDTHLQFCRRRRNLLSVPLKKTKLFPLTLCLFNSATTWMIFWVWELVHRLQLTLFPGYPLRRCSIYLIRQVWIRSGYRNSKTVIISGSKNGILLCSVMYNWVRFGQDPHLEYVTCIISGNHKIVCLFMRTGDYSHLF